MEIAEQKNILRNEFKLKIKEFVSSHKLEDLSSGFQENLNTLFSELNSSKSVGVYSPLNDEVDWTPHLPNSDYRLGYPVINNQENTFEYYTYSGSGDSKIGISLTGDQKGEPLNPDILLIPGLAFDEQGYRLGRGEGYYDRFLENYKGIKIGIVYSCSFNGELPKMDHDQAVDYIVTEKALIRCKA